MPSDKDRSTRGFAAAAAAEVDGDGLVTGLFLLLSPSLSLSTDEARLPSFLPVSQRLKLLLLLF